MTDPNEDRIRQLEKNEAELQFLVASLRNSNEDLTASVKRLKDSVHELSSWKMRLTYPFAIIGIVFTGILMAAGAWAWNGLTNLHKVLSG